MKKNYLSCLGKDVYCLRKIFLTMRISIFILTVNLLSLQAVSFSQKGGINAKFTKAPLKEVIQYIEDHSDFRFLYNEKSLDGKYVSVNMHNANIEELLEKTLQDTENSFRILEDNLVVIAPFKNKFQETTVKGKVIDTEGNPLPGVNIVEVGTTNGVVTDLEGNYSISVNSVGAILSFSFVGYLTEEIQVAGQTNIDITLIEDILALDEVVVIGYGTQKKVNVIGSVTTVTSEEISTAPVAMVSNALVGRLPGAIIQQNVGDDTGEPGRNASDILIRGKATLGNNAPLVVVDGIPGRDMNSLQPSDIESITVLKDASAGIYGARAANGVILVTTKRGTSNKAATFSYGFSQGWQTPTKLPEMADAATYAQMIREMQSYRNVDESNMMFSLEDIEKYKSGDYPWTHPNTDWFAEGLKDYSTIRSHNLSVSGGTDMITYYGSFGTHFNDGIYTNSASSFKRYNLKASVDAKINKLFSVGIDVAGNQANTKFPVRGQQMVFEMLRRSKPTDPAFYPNGYPGPDIEYGDNPVVISGSEPGFDDNKSYTLYTKLSATLNIPGIEGLSLAGYFAYDQNFSTRKFFQRPFTLYSLDEQAYLNAGNTGVEDGSDFLIADPNKGLVPEPQLRDYYDDYNNKVFNLKLNYDKSIGGVHNISAFVSMESSEYMSKGIEAYRRYFATDLLPYLFAGGTDGWNNDGYVGIDSRVNYFGRLMYDYKETYLLQFSLRRDGSLRFSEEHGRWGMFPSILAGWRISNEDFWKNNVSFIDYFKLRASFGQMGNDRVGAFQYLTNYAFGRGVVLGNGYHTAMYQSNNPNPLITWERANIVNAGFESMFLNNKVIFNTDFFYERRSDILVERDASVPAYTGISLPDENYGIVDNKGFEIELGYNNYNRGDFTYSISGNFAFARNEIIEFDEPARSVPWQVRTGHPQGILLLYKSAGIFRDEAHVNSLPHVPGARPGDIIIEDTDGNGEINTDDMVLFDKTADPEITYGLTFNLNYKNWSLSGVIQGTGTTLRSVASDLQTGTVGNYYAYEAEDRWNIENTDATKPRAYEREEEYWRTAYETDYNYQKGGYARLRNLRLSYSVPKQLLNVAMMNDAQIYFSGQNLFLIYSQNKIFDPEFGYMERYPIMKTYSIGVKVSF